MFQLHAFRARVFWSLIPIFFILLVLIGFVDLYQQKHLAEDEIKKRAKSMAENLAYSSRLAVLTEDKWLLAAALQSVTGAADFAYVWIYGEKWSPLIHAAGQSVDLRQLTPTMETKQKERLINRGESWMNGISGGNTNYVEYTAPIVSSQSNLPHELQIESVQPSPSARGQERQKIIGAVRLGLSMNRVDEHMTSFLKWRGWSVAAFLSLSTLAIYVFSVRITRPINRLTEQARRMSQGMLNQPIAVDSRDEVGQLATSFNEMARSLNELYSGLERKVAERTKELTVVNEKLAEAGEHKSRFLANVNHQLRTPLSSIIGYARLLRRETEGQISSLQRESLDDLLCNAKRLLALIDSLLDFAKIEAGKMEIQYEAVRFDELVQGAAATIDPMLNKDAVRLVCDVRNTTMPLYTDREKLMQIILNLLDNAVKFTDRGEIRISACQENGHFKFAVADTGIGIQSAT